MFSASVTISQLHGVMLRVVVAWMVGLLFAGIVHADGAALSAGAIAGRGALPIADKVIVRKAERTMYLVRGNEILRSYRVALGLRPDGHKEQEGDFRTPEGKYKLSRRNARSDYFLSIQVSYPNDDDTARSRKLGVSPGGAIMIHGLPNIPRKPLDYYSRTDWTDGCIAVANSDMVEIWLMTNIDTPIEILP